MRGFPIFLDLDRRPVLLLGMGEVAQRKAVLLAAAGAAIRQRPAFDPADLEGCVLAIGADAPEAELVALHAACIARGIPVNVVDRPPLCSCIMPAVVDRDPVTIAIGTGGAAPMLARMVRQTIEAALHPRLGAVAALLARFQTAVRQRLPDLAARRRFLDAALTGTPASLALAGDDAGAEAAFAAALATAEPAPQGFVWLVGAGPGAPDLLTLRALRLLGQADVIVHDRLGTAEVLDMSRRDAERIFVGKSRANHCLPQEEINALLVRLAGEGKRVVRLKGGDPFVFGRGGEEAEALHMAGIGFEVVPGVTAALACAAAAGIPLTHRDAARALVLATGHTRNGEVDLDFAALARPGHTLAIYMGVTTLARIAAGLAAAGMPATTPAALIESGGTQHQRVLEGSLASVAAEGRDWTGGGPALLLVGAAVGRRSRPGLPAAAA
ncbi:uroporphyrin-III C-methyltransferase/precorrin-2 dehydrogenase/sirohydrochlorin ferrochelatase [Humitalea rosea]|uniref:Uroporphyrin-III C-methyltransferase/precorrin-2 dehydrogenase/sirohydrochlorin ferrochelatase n=1 Tax=Humitalea rosea TaxID=990373 RepID=A0A2W7K698_9PROT|nr:siroheme synthase CysG [Humitalea rosea]PZW43030.1 uroporphyrin-III C-methyltransferase/precorrin-2 dehydrogenase/sirohydrochlorin ferrochelatase [Humitalea rosea]